MFYFIYFYYFIVSSIYAILHSLPLACMHTHSLTHSHRHARTHACAHYLYTYHHCFLVLSVLNVHCMYSLILVVWYTCPPCHLVFHLISPKKKKKKKKRFNGIYSQSELNLCPSANLVLFNRPCQEVLAADLKSEVATATGLHFKATYTVRKCTGYISKSNHKIIFLTNALISKQHHIKSINSCFYLYSKLFFCLSFLFCVFLLCCTWAPTWAFWFILSKSRTKSRP